MQASKIKPHETYAIKGDQGEYLRFRVEAVVTRRISSTGSPHDHQSTVEGHIHLEDRGGAPVKTLTIQPGAILGPYKDYVELQEREAREQAEAEAKDKARRKAMLELVIALYHALEMKLPEAYDSDWQNYKLPIHLDYNWTEIRFEPEAIAPLRNFLTVKGYLLESKNDQG